MDEEDDSLAGLWERHRLEVRDDGSWHCSMGDVGWEADYSMAKFHHDTHMSRLQSAWLKRYDYGYPFGYLRPATTCLRCGLLVGLPDRHREVCHG